MNNPLIIRTGAFFENPICFPPQSPFICSLPSVRGEGAGGWSLSETDSRNLAPAEIVQAPHLNPEIPLELSATHFLELSCVFPREGTPFLITEPGESPAEGGQHPQGRMVSGDHRDAFSHQGSEGKALLLTWQHLRQGINPRLKENKNTK